jgi:acyl-CoA reductase-like NAD-dependent aldehyde dehydrogenase
MAANGTQTNGKISLDFSKFYNVINGELLTTGTTRHGINPSTLEPNPEVPVSTPEDVNKAVEGARAAAESWAAVPLEERQQAVLKFAQALGSLAEDFGAMLTKEQGKPVRAPPTLSVPSLLMLLTKLIANGADSSKLLKARSTEASTGSQSRPSSRFPRM